jgi:hypothetical protein
MIKPWSLRSWQRKENLPQTEKMLVSCQRDSIINHILLSPPQHQFTLPLASELLRLLHDVLEPEGGSVVEVAC